MDIGSVAIGRNQAALDSDFAVLVAGGHVLIRTINGDGNAIRNVVAQRDLAGLVADRDIA